MAFSQPVTHSTHPDALLRMALACWTRTAPQTLTPVQAKWLIQRLASHTPLTDAERARVVPPLLVALEAYDGRVAAVVRGHLAGEEDVAWRGARSSDGLVKVLTIVKQLQDAEDTAPAAARKSRTRTGKRKN